ncbi:MAG: MOSC domain-containing protein [Gemmatimonadota bacterium]|nr:MOSC domain-containing protein [Gemmatimonadota bacterium]
MTAEARGYSGAIVSLNISAGGVPKLPVEAVAIEFPGIVGDGHNDRKHHGGPDRAVCIYSRELIELLRTEGHPVEPGSAGENITVAGLDWSLMVPGVRLRLGTLEVEVTAYTSPCKTIGGSFVDRNFMRISQIKNPGWSRVYARVLVPGYVKTGDPVVITTGGVAHSLP